MRTTQKRMGIPQIQEALNLLALGKGNAFLTNEGSFAPQDEQIIRVATRDLDLQIGEQP